MAGLLFGMVALFWLLVAAGPDLARAVTSERTAGTVERCDAVASGGTRCEVRTASGVVPARASDLHVPDTGDDVSLMSAAGQAPYEIVNLGTYATAPALLAIVLAGAVMVREAFDYRFPGDGPD